MPASVSSSSKASAPSAGSWLEDGGALFAIGLGEELASSPMGSASVIGPYRLMEKLGEGGLGVVWRAEQLVPIQREVAIKFTKPGLHFRAEVITRFELERQALARMNHPNIAAILDAGTLPDERPYFVMELVRGEPLTAYCTRHRLGVRQRLELFIVICNAVHHAHQKGILHRDLKPSNILVAEVDGEAVPKVIDFGIAKALDDTDAALNDPFFKTQLGDLPCATYQYMSPEQASRGHSDIDTRSDIYTLGVLLYELLTGKLPLPDELARSNSFEAIASHVCNSDPTRPSERIADTGTKTSALRGDLDWIVLQALEKDRERRYESAASLAEDLRRHLAHEPVTAGPPSTLYRCGKWLRRHRLAFATMAAVATSLCLGLGSTLLALQREKAALGREAVQRAKAETSREQAMMGEREAMRARDVAAAARDAEALARQAAEASRAVADTARGRAEVLINDMLFGLRDALEPLGRVRLLEQVSSSAQGYFESVPPSEDSDGQGRNRAAMLLNRGSILLAVGDATGAMKVFAQALSMMKARAMERPKDMQRLHDLALAYERVGGAQEALKDDAGAGRSYAEMARVFEHVQASEAADAAALLKDQAVAYERLGDLARKRGDVEQARVAYERGVALLKPLPGGGVVQRRLAVLAGKLGAVDGANAAQHFERELALWSALLADAADDVELIAGTAVAHGHVASVRSGAMAVDDAQAQVDAFAKLTLLEPLRVDWQRLAAMAEHQLGVALEAADKLSEAVEAYRRELGRRLRLPESKRDEAAARLRLAAGLLRLKAVDEARAEARLVLSLLEGDADAEAVAWRATATELVGVGRD